MKITEILAGNKEFATHADKSLLKKLAEKGQKPFAAVVACSDSRVPVEVIFNQLKPGSLFVIRVAGNVVADAGVKGSIEYAVEHLKMPYLIVLGHTDCGAVKAALGGAHGGEIGKLLDGIKLNSKDMEAAVKENLFLQAEQVLKMDCVKNAVVQKTLTVYGMIYDIANGKIDCLTENSKPYQE
jgi:carbonic anhydrase